MKVFISLLIAFILAIPGYCQDIIVSNNGSTGFDSIQSAINAAVDGDTVILEPSTYTGDGNRDIDFLGKAITVRSTDPNDPDIVAATIIDCNGAEEDPHRGFYFHRQEGTSSVLAGLTIRSGNAEYGGAICCWADFGESNGPTIEKCILTENKAYYGGAIGCIRSEPTISGCIIKGNHAVINGGGIDGSVYSASYSVFDCVIQNNYAGSNGGAIASCNGVISRCTIKSNNATKFGGAIFDCKELANCLLSGNTAKQGGSVYLCDLITNCVITGNKARDGGGLCAGRTRYSAVHNNNIKVRIDNCTLCSNKAENMGGAIFTALPSFSEDVIDIVLNECVIWDNISKYGYQVGFVEYTISVSEPPFKKVISTVLTVDHSDLQGGKSSIYVDPNGTLVWGQGNIDNDSCFAKSGYWDPNGTPDDANDDFWIDGDYHLKSQAGRWDPNAPTWVKDDVTSPCIDTGDPASPIGLEPFPNGGRINMGAYGGSAEASKSYFGGPVCETIIAGDINGDCIVNFTDLQIVASHWLSDNNP